MSHRCNDAQLVTSGLAVGHDRYLLHLLAAFARRRESHRHITLLAWRYTAARIVGHSAAARSLASADNQIGIAAIAKMEAIGYILVRCQPPKVVLITVKQYLWHFLPFVVPMWSVGVLYYRRVDVRPAAATAARQGQECHHTTRKICCTK